MGKLNGREDDMERNNTPALETERLILRKFTEHDTEAILHIYGDSEMNAFLPWFPIKTMKEARTLFEERYAGEYEKICGYRYAVCLKSDNVPIGYVHISTEEGHDLGYGLRKEFWHRGIMTEAARAVVRQVKEDGYPYITATHDVKNQRSGDVMRRLGMNYQYTYEEQWQPKDILVTFRMYQLNFDKVNARRHDRYWILSKVHYVEDELVSLDDVGSH